MNVHIAIIHHGEGEDLYLGATKADMDRQVAEYVDENWDPAKHGEKPEDAAESIEQYFDKENEMLDRLGEGEWWEDKVLPVEGATKD
jgi:hypothetical protein